jgi:hypothetical protein
MPDRRTFLASMAGVAAAAAVHPTAAAREVYALVLPERLEGVLDSFAGEGRSSGEVARDENLWREVQQAFTVDRSLVNLNNGGVSPAPAVVQDAMQRYLAYANEAPVYTMWQVLEPQKEGLRQRLARLSTPTSGSSRRSAPTPVPTTWPSVPRSPSTLGSGLRGRRRASSISGTRGPTSSSMKTG